MSQYKACGVIFRRAGKIYDFLSGELPLSKNDLVVVESDKGADLAKVVIPPRLVEAPEEREMKSVLRIAAEEDINEQIKNEKDGEKAFNICKKLAAAATPDMKLVSAEYCLDRSKLTFYFTAEGRIDFRQLVRDLARIFRTRIEMRQIGVRDSTKMIGGFGMCGRELCCTGFLKHFDNISIKMAKNQNLVLNPNKISGVCGRLMCCLMYEKEQYGWDEEQGDFIEITDENLNEDGADK